MELYFNIKIYDIKFVRNIYRDYCQIYIYIYYIRSTNTIMEEKMDHLSLEEDQNIMKLLNPDGNNF